MPMTPPSMTRCRLWPGAHLRMCCGAGSSCAHGGRSLDHGTGGHGGARRGAGLSGGRLQDAPGDGGRDRCRTGRDRRTLRGEHLRPRCPCADPGALDRYLGSLRAAGPLGDGTWDDDGFDGKVAALLADPPPVTSFTFGCPAAEVVRALQDAGSLVAVTVTSPGEAAIAAAAGADALCVQGYEAGAHRGTFVNDDEPGRDYGLLALIGEVARVTGLPQIAAGGIMGPRQVQAVIAAGAVAAQCGTAFLRCPESGAHPRYKAALADPRYTATTLTRAFSGGRPAGWSTGSFAITRARPRPTRRSTTRHVRCGRRPPPRATPSGCHCGPGRATGRRPSIRPARSSNA